MLHIERSDRVAQIFCSDFRFVSAVSIAPSYYPSYYLSY